VVEGRKTIMETTPLSAGEALIIIAMFVALLVVCGSD
jgi:hypothetical protein